MKLRDPATKEDISLIRKDLDIIKLELEKEIALINSNLQKEIIQVKSDLVKWVLGTGVATILAIAGLLKLIH